MIEPCAVLLYLLFWVSFGVGHSLLASAFMRRWMAQRVGAYERLAYNGIAVFHLALVLLGGAWCLGRAPGFDLPPAVKFCLATVRGISLFGLLLALREYDIGRLAGLTQIRIGQRQIPDGPDELFVVTGLHRYVRHPLYSASILFLMGGATSLLGLTTAIFATSYFVIGMKFEDRKLARLYGDIYRDYRQRTPALIPFWRP
jgi:protein-S-isoprenylcysteine O-methyltransferase Ste14